MTKRIYFAKVEFTNGETREYGPSERAEIHGSGRVAMIVLKDGTIKFIPLANVLTISGVPRYANVEEEKRVESID